MKLAFVEEMEEDKDAMEMPVLGIKDKESNGNFPKGWQGVMKNIGTKVVNIQGVGDTKCNPQLAVVNGNAFVVCNQ